VTRVADYHPQFDCDVREAAAWFETRVAGLGAEFSLAVEQLILRVMNNPGMYPEIRPAYRRAIVRRFRYILIFRHKGESVRFVGTLHGSRNLDEWLERRNAAG
jgi:plasmid stabilization system protein ParE